MKKCLQILKGEYEELSFEEVLERYSGLIRKFASPFCKIYDFDDLLQVGSIALWEAYTDYDIETGYTFTNYAHRKIDFAIKQYHRDRTYKFSNKLSKVRELMTCNITELLETDSSNYHEFDFDRYFLVQEIVEIIKSFRMQKRQIWYLHLLGYNNAEIGKRVGVSGWWVTLSMREDVKKIRKEFKGA